MQRTVGRYELQRELGRGGMAIVYLAHQTDLDRSVALKELAALNHPDPTFGKRFERESRLIASLSHPNIVTVFDYFEHDGVPFIAMEYVDRGSLRPFMKSFTVAQAAGVLEGVLAGLAHAETKGIVHRDLKPENIMVDADGRVKIADYGIAKVTSGSKNSAFLTATGMTVGTPLYMAPEQAMAQDIGPQTDLYSVGAMAYEMFCGRPPIEGGDSPMAILLRVLNETPKAPRELNPALSPDLSDWIMRLLVKDPKKRTPNATQAWDELEEIVIHELGPRWRREARLVDRDAGFDTPQPLTPAPFQSGMTPTPTPGAHPAAPPAPAPPPVEEAPADDEFESFHIGAARAPSEVVDAPVDEPAAEVAVTPPPAPASTPPPAPAPPAVEEPPAAATPAPAPAPPTVREPPAAATPPPVPTPPPAPAPPPVEEPPAAATPPPAPAPPAAEPEPEPQEDDDEFRTFRGGAASPYPPPPKPPPAPVPPPPAPPRVDPVPEPVALQPPPPTPTPTPTAPAPPRRPDPTPVVPDEGYAATVAPRAVEPPPPVQPPPAPAEPPGEDEEERKRSSAARRGIALIAGIGLVCAIVGFLIAPAREEEAPTTPQSSASAGPVALSYPSTFTKVDPPPALATELLTDPVALTPSGRTDTVVAAGTAAADGPTLLPAGLVDGLDAQDIPKPTRVKLGDVEALRYDKVPQSGSDDLLRVYAVPTDDKVAYVVCGGPAAGLEAIAGDCERIATSLKLNGVQAYPAGPSDEYAKSLSEVLDTLKSGREDGLGSLRSATNAKAQAGGATAIATAYRQAASELKGLELSPYDAPANARLVAELSAVGRRYAALASAARNGQSKLYSRARQAIPQAEKRVQDAIANLDELGYDVAS